MKIVMVSPVLNIHQVEVADELYRLTKGYYRFIQTDPIDIADKKGGNNDYTSRPYLIIAPDSSKTLVIQIIGNLL